MASGRTTGFYLFGAGGCGKSFTITDELDRLQIPYKLCNSRMTGRGLYNQLASFPDCIHLLEDMESLLNDPGARGVLRSALWNPRESVGDGPIERIVTWTTHQMEHRFVFTGGLIMTANRPFPENAELDAVKTRIAYWELVVGDYEIIAMMKHLALHASSDGRSNTDPSERLEVCDFIIAECHGLNRCLDLRLFVNGLSYFAQWRECQSGCHWQDLVSALIRERPTRIRDVRSTSVRKKQLLDELAFAAGLSAVADREERYRLWREKTGKSEPTLYRRMEQAAKAHP